MATPEQDALQDLAYAEGPAELADASAEDYGAEDYGTDYGAEDYGAEDYGADYGAEDYGTDYGAEDPYMADAGAEDLFGEGGLESEEAEDVISRMLGEALGAEDEGEALEGFGSFLKKASRVVGKVARGAAPILRLIPHPAAQGAAAVASVLGKLRAEGATTSDALEAVAEMAARGAPGAVPVVAGLAAREVLRGAAPRMLPAQRAQAAKAITRAASSLVQAGGPAAARAIPKLVASVNRTAVTNGTPLTARPKVVARAAAQLARNPNALRRLSAPSQRARQILGMAASRPGPNGRNGGQRRSGSGIGWGQSGDGRRTRRINVSGPATITISVG